MASAQPPPARTRIPSTAATPLEARTATRSTRKTPARTSAPHTATSSPASRSSSGRSPSSVTARAPPSISSATEVAGSEPTTSMLPRSVSAAGAAEAEPAAGAPPAQARAASAQGRRSACLTLLQARHGYAQGGGRRAAHIAQQPQELRRRLRAGDLVPQPAAAAQGGDRHRRERPERARLRYQRVRQRVGGGEVGVQPRVDAAEVPGGHLDVRAGRPQPRVVVGVERERPPAEQLVDR